MISAKEEKYKYAIRGEATDMSKIGGLISVAVTRARYALNAAIGLQVITGVLTTAISAATSGRQVSVADDFLCVSH